MHSSGPGRCLVLVASDDLTGDELSAVRRLRSEGARIVSWQHPIGGQDRLPSPDVDKYLRDRGVEAQGLASLLGERVNTEVDEALIRFMKELGRARLGELGSFRDAFRYHGLSLWWWAELWLYYDTELRLHLRDVEALARLLEREAPARLVLVAPLGQLDRIARGLFSDVQTLGETRRRERSAPRPFAAFVRELLKMLGTGLKSSLRGVPHRTEGARRRVLCFTHASMWRKRENPETGEIDDVEMYFDRLLPMLEADGNVVIVVGVGPRDPFQRRGLTARLREMAGIGSKRLPYRPLSAYLSFSRALEASRAYWICFWHYRRLSRAPGLSEALTHRGVSLASEGKEALFEAFLRLIPSAMRSFVEIRALLAVERPDVFVLYAESTALGRAAVAAAASAHVPSFAIQHGIMYPFYYSHEHAPHEIVSPFDGTEGVPIPTRTAVFGRQAERLFLERGHYDAGRIVVTGSPKFDVLFQTRDRLQKSEIRSRLGLDDEAPLLVVASRFSSIGSAFRGLLRAAEAIPELILAGEAAPGGAAGALHGSGGSGIVHPHDSRLSERELARAHRCLERARDRGLVRFVRSARAGSPRARLESPEQPSNARRLRPGARRRPR